MTHTLLLILLTTLFVGCKKEDENENYRIAGKWVLYSMIIDDELKSCNPNKLIDEFTEDGKYFGFLTGGIEVSQQSSATYALKGDEFKMYLEGMEKKFKVIELSDTFLGLANQSHNGGVLYMFEKQ